LPVKESFWAFVFFLFLSYTISFFETWRLSRAFSDAALRAMPVVSVFFCSRRVGFFAGADLLNYPSSSTIKTRVFLQPAASSALKFRLAFSWSNRHRLRCSEYEIDIHVLSSLLLHISNRSSGFIHGLSCVYSCLISLSESEWEREKQDGME
jgi:hypothetical protein